LIRLALSEARYMWSHPARDTRAVARFAAWQLRCVLRRPAVVPFKSYKAMLYCPAERRGTAKLIYTFREECEPEIPLLREIVREGDSVIDAGAHYGVYTVPLGRLVGSRGSVLAIEPASHAVAILRHNVSLNALSQVSVVQAALGDQSGEAVLSLHADPSRNRLCSPGVQGTVGERIPLTMLDAIVRVRPVRFLKIDVEGAEGSVIGGGRGVISNDRPVVLFEHNHLAGEVAKRNAPQAWAELQALGYTMSRIDVGSGVSQVLSEPPLGIVNILAMP
jgi:FkbM family methyltransferase